MKIYLDVCCLCRPFDDQTSYRIKAEAGAVIEVLNRCTTGWDLIESEVIDYELEQMSDREKIEAIKCFLNVAHDRVLLSDQIITRAHTFHTMGIDAFDALHLASAESVGAVFLTTDDSLVRHINMNDDTILIEANNPLMWLMEEKDGNENTE